MRVYNSLRKECFNEIFMTELERQMPEKTNGTTICYSVLQLAERALFMRDALKVTTVARYCVMRTE
jgi:hypothetical protein